jgi:hypothetical protein
VPLDVMRFSLGKCGLHSAVAENGDNLAYLRLQRNYS